MGLLTLPAGALEVRPWPFAAEEAVCYGPYRDGQRPGTGSPSDAELREDLEIMARHWGLVRTYGCVEFGENLLRVARAEDRATKFLLGVWIARDEPEANRRELSTAIELANGYPELIAAIAVGNETQVSWSGHRCAPETLIEAIRELRAAVSVPVTTADDYSFWLLPESRAIADEVDFITFHAHPMWNGVELEDALQWLAETTRRVRAVHPDRLLVLGETGWATSVADEGEEANLIRGAAGAFEQSEFRTALLRALPVLDLTAFWFEAFDESWKGGSNPAAVEKHWGLYDARRQPKFSAAD